MTPQSQTAPQRQQTPSADDQWYIAKDERQFGPIKLSELAHFARQGMLRDTDWIWRPGLENWMPAADVAGLFARSAAPRHEPQQAARGVAGTEQKPDGKSDYKARAKSQLKDFALMAFYLWIVFGLLALHESIILAEHQISYVAHGLAVINALVFAKVMLIAEDLHLGHRLHQKPLIYSIVFKSILFAIALICFHIIEHVLVGMWHGQPIGESIADVGANKLKSIVSLGIIGTVALIPFFILSEISRVMGEHKFWDLIFSSRSP